MELLKTRDPIFMYLFWIWSWTTCNYNCNCINSHTKTKLKNTSTVTHTIKHIVYIFSYKHLYIIHTNLWFEWVTNIQSQLVHVLVESIVCCVGVRSTMSASSMRMIPLRQLQCCCPTKRQRTVLIALLSFFSRRSYISQSVWNKLKTLYCIERWHRFCFIVKAVSRVGLPDVAK